MSSVQNLRKFIQEIILSSFTTITRIKALISIGQTKMKNISKNQGKIAVNAEKPFNPNLKLSIKSYASKKSIGAAFEQRNPEDWQTVAFASRFLNAVQ